ncbi:MAG: ATP-binding cassette domain-containing protein [Cytophagales bacterium]|nr:ATP-binding cassette domain-containing protein [Cytophagales bacterium]MDW8383286.1 ATP-binding cassette domain-containing protein [Flammeovirgaceae bacterium]
MSFVVSVRNLYVEHRQKQVLKDVSFDVADGEFLYLIGKTGSGKSSLLKVLYADLPIHSGWVEVADYDLTLIKHHQIPFLRRKLGIIFQDFELLYDRNVFENLAFVLRATDWKDSRQIRQRIEEVLESVGLSDKIKNMPHQLSGGEQQRVVIARALLNRPRLLLADEPTGNLDPVVSAEILELFKKIHRQGAAVIIATHYHNFLKQFPSRVLYCEEGIVRDIEKEFVVKRMEESFKKL